MQNDFKEIGKLVAEIIEDVTAAVSHKDKIPIGLRIEVTRTASGTFHFRGIDPGGDARRGKS